MSRIAVAFILSVLFFFLFMFIGEISASYLGEGAAVVLTFAVMTAYFFVCQFRLSRGNAEALRKDWPIMLGLNAVPLAMVIIMIFVEKWPVILAQGLIVLAAGWGGAFAGAVAASRAARRRQGAR